MSVEYPCIFTYNCVSNFIYMPLYFSFVSLLFLLLMCFCVVSGLFVVMSLSFQSELLIMFVEDKQNGVICNLCVHYYTCIYAHVCECVYACVSVRASVRA